MVASRRMASMKEVREHWGLPYGVCFRCRRNAQVVRGHVIAHSAGGSGDVTNLVPLCATCNKLCVPWMPGDEVMAWAWMKMDAVTYSAEVFRDSTNQHIQIQQMLRDRFPDETESIEEFVNDLISGWVKFIKGKEEQWRNELATDPATSN